MAGSNSTSTREKLLGLVDDIELITKEIFENAIAPKVIKVKKRFWNIAWIQSHHLPFQ